ncbi:metal-dependent hydrolase [Metabacillus sp. SLBN-84]
MLGRTHVIGSLALMHAGLLVYTTHKDLDGHVHIAPHQPDEVLTVFGFQFGQPLTFAEYSLILTSILFFILLLLRIGGGRMLAGYFGLASLSMGALKFGLGSDYAFNLSLILFSFALGTVLPDIDSEDSTIGKYIKPVSRLIPHRTITHTVWAILLVAGLAWVLESVHLAALAIGYAVHIAEDSFSEQGIRWLYPVPARKSKRRRPFVYETGGLAETVMLFTAIGVHTACIGFMVWSNFGANGSM